MNTQLNTNPCKFLSCRRFQKPGLLNGEAPTYLY